MEINLLKNDTIGEAKVRLVDLEEGTQNFKFLQNIEGSHIESNGIIYIDQNYQQVAFMKEKLLFHEVVKA